MKLYMKQKVFSWKEKFDIYDVNETEKYYVEGEFFSFNKKLHLYSLADLEMAYIEEKMWSLLPKYYIYRDDVLKAEVVKEFTFLHPKYTIDAFDWEVGGDFWEHEYEITQNGSVIISVSKKWLSWGDTYEIYIKDGVDEINALAVVLIIDAVTDREAQAASVAVNS